MKDQAMNRINKLLAIILLLLATTSFGTDLSILASLSDDNAPVVISEDNPLPVSLADGALEVDLGANIGLLNSADEAIDPATEDKQDDGIAILTTIDADTGATALGVGGTADAAVAAGAVGSISAKLRRVTTDLAAVETTLTNLESVMMGAGAPVIDSYGSAVIDAAAGATANVIATPGEDKQIWIYAIQATADTAAGIVTFKDTAALAFTGAMAVSDEGHLPAMVGSGNFAMPLFKLPSNTGFDIVTVACTLDGSVQYAIVDVS